MAAPMSDVSGYRSDGGGLGQDQGLSKQLRGVMTAKLPLLSAPGTVLENSLYYDINSSSVTAVEEQATFAKDRIVLNNFTMGATPSAYIPSVLFAGSVFWFLELPDVVLPNGVDNNFQVPQWSCAIPHGWGFAALQQLIVYMGASSIAQIAIGAVTNFLANLATCETYSKRSRMIQGAGQYLVPNDTRSLMAKFVGTLTGLSIFRESAYGDFYNPLTTFGSVDAPWLRHAVVPLRLPWASMVALDKRLSMDTKLSTQPIQITLQTSARDDFMYLGTSLKAIFPQVYADSTLQMWQEELSDKSLSVRNELLAMPEFNVGYPFQYAQSIPFEILASNDSGATQFVFLMNITSIINSDLTTFLFSVNWNGRTDPTAGQIAPLYGEMLQDIELLLNGQRFFFFDRQSYDSVTLAKQMDSSQYNLLMPSSNYAVDPSGPVTGFLTRGNVYEFNNSRLRSIVAENHMQNTARFTNQTFQLRFKINRTDYYLGNAPIPPAPSSTTKYSVGFSKTSGFTLNMTYLYNAVYLVGGDGGTTKLITN